MRIGIDLDEVLASSNEALIKFHNEKYGTNFVLDDIKTYHFQDLWGGTRDDAVRKVDEFFSRDQLVHIAPVPGSVEAIEKLEKLGHELYIITGRSADYAHRTERWIEGKFPKIFKSVHYVNFFTLNKEAVVRQKSEVCKELGIELLIDDNPKTAQECGDAGIRVLLYDRKWNQGIEYPPLVTRIFSWGDILKIVVQ